MAVILIGIDYFTLFNDCYGHQTGDACLRQVAACLKSEVNRSHDLVSRYGDEEFVCVLPQTPLAGAEAKARSLEGAVRALAVAHEKTVVRGYCHDQPGGCGCGAHGSWSAREPAAGCGAIAISCQGRQTLPRADVARLAA
jgi:GGDEF domain-containing protein